MRSWRRTREFKQRLREIDSYNRQAEEIYSSSTHRFALAKREARESLVRLGGLKIALWERPVQSYIDDLNRFSDISPISITGNEANIVSADTLLLQMQRNCSAIKKFGEIAGTHDNDALVSIAIQGSGALLSFTSMEDAESYLDRYTRNNNVVRWLNDEACFTDHFGSGTVLPKPEKKHTTTYSSLLVGFAYEGSYRGEHSRARQFYSDSSRFSAGLGRTTAETQAIKRTADAICAYISDYCSHLTVLSAEISRIEQDYSKPKDYNKVPFAVLSDIEKRTVSVMLLETYSLCTLLYAPLFASANNAVTESEKSLNLAKGCFFAVRDTAEELQTEKTQINSLLSNARSYYEGLVSIFRLKKTDLRKKLIEFADYKLSVWKAIGSRYYGALAKLQDIPFDQEMICVSPQVSFDLLKNETEKFREIATKLDEQRAQCTEYELLRFAINSTDYEGEGNLHFYLWLCEDPPREITVDGIGQADFENIVSTLQTITGKESLLQAQSLSTRVHTDSAGIENVISEMNALIKCIDGYQKETNRMIRDFMDIADQVIVILSPYDSVVSPLTLTSQERKTVSFSWNYGQLLYRVLTDSFYRQKDAILSINDGIPDVIYNGTKNIKEKAFRFRGEAGYAVDELYKRGANTTKKISIAVFLAFALIAVLAAPLVHVLGLSYLLSAVIVFPYPFIEKIMPLNKLVLVRIIQIISATVCAVAITLLLVI